MNNILSFDEFLKLNENKFSDDVYRSTGKGALIGGASGSALAGGLNAYARAKHNYDSEKNSKPGEKVKMKNVLKGTGKSALKGAVGGGIVGARVGAGVGAGVGAYGHTFDKYLTKAIQKSAK